MYAYEGASSEAETQAWLDKNLTRYRNNDSGLCAVILKDNALMIEQAGLTWQEVNGGRVPEVGYLFHRARVTQLRRLRLARNTAFVGLDSMKYTPSFTPEQRELIQIRYPANKVGSPLLLFFAIIGSLLIGASIILVFATNWWKLPIVVKIILAGGLHSPYKRLIPACA